MNLSSELREHFSALGKLGAQKRQQNLSPEQRKEIATKASLAAKAKRDAAKH